MNTRSLPRESLAFPISTTITDGGRTYAICSQGQMNFLLREAQERITSEAMDRGEKLTDKEIQGRLAEWEKTCGYTTMPRFFARLTPEEQEEWKARYRFSGLTAGKKGNALA